MSLTKAQWRTGARVVAHGVGSHYITRPLSQPAPGTIIQMLMRRGGQNEAWVRLDARLTGDDERLHPFPADDVRGRDVPTDRFSCSPEVAS